MKSFWEKYKDIVIQITLFVVTVYTTTLAGQDWVKGKTLSEGLIYSIPFLFILTCHEFGHYFTSKYHHVKASLPYYIPMYLGGIGLSIGTMGAFIRMKSPAITTKQIFDIGIAGPLAGFVVALGVMFYAYTHLPEKSYIFGIHEEYKNLGDKYEDKVFTYEFARYQDSLRFEMAKKEGYVNAAKPFEPEKSYELMKLGDNLLMRFFAEYVADKSLLPSSFEMYHYPLLMVAFLALFFTSLNLMPIGQLDGGHIMYGLVGEKAFNIISPIAFFIFVFYGGLGMVSPFMTTEELSSHLPLYGFYLYIIFRRIFPDIQQVLIAVLSMLALQLVTVYLFPNAMGYDGWLAFGFVLGQFVGIYHPPVLIEERLGLGRKLLGWIAIVIFVISFSPTPFDFVTLTR
jgi:membrane-associated protease RseP (regulator of RpoE activity)